MSINRFAKDDSEKPFHSSGYAEVASSGRMGATSSRSFQQRYRADQNRKAIQRYRDSHIARGGHAFHDKQHPLFNVVKPPEAQVSPQDRRQAANAGEQNTASPSSDVSGPVSNRAAFTEPPSRDYNPYG